MPQELALKVAIPMTALLTPAEVAAMLKVSLAWVYKHSNGTHRPTLKRVPLGRAVRFRPEDVEAFVEMCRKAAGE